MKITTHTIPLLVGAVLATDLSGQGLPADLVVQPFQPDGASTDVLDTRDIVLADLDGDGDLDLYLANEDQDNAMYLNDGAGNFTRHFEDQSVNHGNRSRGIALGDMDSDGDLDLYVANYWIWNFLYRNEGGSPPVFIRVTTGPIALDPTRGRQASFVDVDGDGDLDIYATNFNQTDNFLYINQGGSQGGVEGEFAKSFEGDATNDGSTSYGIALGDIDADADLDLFVTNHGGLIGSPGSPNALYLNDGAGVFDSIAMGSLTTDVRNSMATAFVDVDGDADLDLFVGNSLGEGNQLYLNDGTGVLEEQLEGVLQDDRGKTIGSAWDDVDGDGDVDVILANRSPAVPSKLYLNDGEGGFVRQGFGPLSVNTTDSYDVTIGDADGDGRLDVAFANMGGTNDVLRNLGPQWTDLGFALRGALGTPGLSVEGSFQPGEAVSLEAGSVPDGAPVFLIVGSTFAPTAFHGGTLVVDPVDGIDRMFVAANAGASGTVGFWLTVPVGLPAGTGLLFQAWIEDAAGPQGFSATNGLRAVMP